MVSTPVVWSTSDSDRFSFLTATEWKNLYSSKGLAARKNVNRLPNEMESDDYPCIFARNRYTFVVASDKQLTDKKINKLMKHFILPEGVRVEWKRQENGTPIFTFSSSNKLRKQEILTYAVKWTSYDGEQQSVRLEDPRYGIAPNKVQPYPARLNEIEAIAIAVPTAAPIAVAATPSSDNTPNNQ